MVQSCYIFMIATLAKTYKNIALDGLIFLYSACTSFNQNKTHKKCPCQEILTIVNS
jgi:hypothetical protein